MRVGVAVALWASSLLATPARAAGGSGSPAAGLDIRHQAVGCVVAGSFARLDACIQPSAGRTLAYFRAGGTASWYYVQLAPRPDAAGCVSGALPKPLRRTKAIEYYLEATSPALASARTEEFKAAVVGSAGECGERKVALGASAASVVVGAPPGAPALPAGFSSAGIVTAAPPASASPAASPAASAAPPATGAGGGLSGSTLALVIGGGVAAAGGVALAVGGGGGDAVPASGGSGPGGGGTTTTSTSTTTTTTQPAGPTAVLGFVSSAPPPGSSVQDPGGTFTLALTVAVSVQSAAAVANARLFVTLRRGASLCVTSYADIGSLAAGSARTVPVSGFVVAASCRPVPFTTDTAWLRVYDMAGSPTSPIGETSAAVSYNIVP